MQNQALDFYISKRKDYFSFCFVKLIMLEQNLYNNKRCNSFLDQNISTSIIELSTKKFF